MLFMPSPITSTGDGFLAHVHSDFYDKARKYVENGGFLYASVAADAAVPEMTSLFGARLVDRAVSSEVTVKFIAPFGDFKVGDTLHYAVPASTPESWGAILEISTGKIIAVDQDGHPALVSNTVGAGKTLLSAYPIEHYLANVPAVFDKPEETHRIYAAFRDWAGVKPAFRTDLPAMEATSLTGDHRGYLIVVNHSAETQHASVTSSLAVHSVTRITPEGGKAVNVQGASWKVDLGPYEGAVLEWKQ